MGCFSSKESVGREDRADRKGDRNAHKKDEGEFETEAKRRVSFAGNALGDEDGRPRCVIVRIDRFDTKTYPMLRRSSLLHYFHPHACV